MSSSPNSSSSSDAAKTASQPMAWLMDVPCRVEFVLGTARVKVSDCLKFDRQMVVMLDQPAGADLELRADGVRIATGEVVVVDDRAGLRINQILPPVPQEQA